MAPDGAGAPATALGHALAALHERVPLGMRLGLDAMRAACARAGHPERAFPAVHVAGTNGKGSTVAMVEAMARAAGLRTGLYTSPHLCRFGERIRIDGEPLGDEALARVLGRALEVGRDLSFFETATLAAFFAFEEHEVDLAVLEVGLGGRFDATNVIPPPRCAAITRIALDHTGILGDTLEAIAREKAGIAKPGAPLVVGSAEPSVRAVFEQAARGAGARLLEADETPPALPAVMPGAYQAENARIAWRIGRELDLPEAARLEGLRAARWPGRFERVVARGPLAGPWLLDGAHNPDGARALATALAHERVAAIVFGALADKSWEEMADAVAALAPEGARCFVAPRGRAAVDPERLVARAGGAAAASVPSALALARAAAGPEGLVVVCGSLFLVGEARATLLGLPMDPPVAL